MFKRSVFALTAIVIMLCLTNLVQAASAKPAVKADKAIQAYAELYAFGTSNQLSATGLKTKIKKT